ncbi:MAG: HEAT repeat domain-containing protein [Pirellulaceae bacterium]
MIANLASSDPKVRKVAADKCVFVGPTKPLIEALGNTLTDSESDVRVSAGVTLFVAGSSVGGIISQLIVALDDSDIRVRRLAAACLSNVGADALPALPRLLQLASDADWILRKWVDQAIVNITGNA